MPRFYQASHSISIAASPERTYEALTDWAERVRWRKGFAIERDGGSKAFIGQNVSFKAEGSLIPYAFSYRVTGLEPPRRVYLQYTGPVLKGRGAVEIVPEGSSCRVSFHWMKVEPGNLTASVLFGLGWVSRAHERNTRETLRMLKAYLEEV